VLCSGGADEEGDGAGGAPEALGCFGQSSVTLRRWLPAGGRARAAGGRGAGLTRGGCGRCVIGGVSEARPASAGVFAYNNSCCALESCECAPSPARAAAHARLGSRRGARPPRRRVQHVRDHGVYAGNNACVRCYATRFR